MKKIRCGAIIFLFSFVISGCAVGGYWNEVEVDLIITPNNPSPGSDITVKCANYDLFDFGTLGETDWDEMSFYKGCFSVCKNAFRNNGFEYSSSMTQAAVFKQKISDREAVYTLTSNVVSSYISLDGVSERNSTAQGCDKYNKMFDDLKANPKYLHIAYPKTLTLDKTSAKAGDKVTVTSSNPFFDEATFSNEKVKKLADAGYYIVWYSVKNVMPDGYEYYPNHNPDKKPVPQENIDLDTLTPTSVTFTVPTDAITGTIHVINEGGFDLPKTASPSSAQGRGSRRCSDSETNDLNIVGNVDGAYAYYATEKELTIIK